MLKAKDECASGCKIRNIISAVCIALFAGTIACNNSESDDSLIADSSTAGVPDSAGVENSTDSTLEETGTASETEPETAADTMVDTFTDSATILTTDDADTASDSQQDSPVTWTVLMYMAADSDLEAAMLADLDELRAVAVPEWLNILILFDRHPLLDTSDGDWTGTRLYRVNPKISGGLERLADAEYLNMTNTGDADELDMGDGTTLEKFLRYAKDSYAADHYALVLSGHGSGLMKKDFDTSSYLPQGICSDYSGTKDGMSIQAELAPLLELHPVDVLGFDACLMGMVEVAWAVKDQVQYVIASEGNESSDGWDYSNWLLQWIDSADHSPRSFTETQMTSYKNHYSAIAPPFQVMISAIDTSLLPALGDAINELSANYTISDFVYQAMTFDDLYRDYYDLWQIADVTADENLKSAIEAAVIYNWYSHGPGTPGGLSIMYVEIFPDAYLNTSFCQDLDWC